MIDSLFFENFIFTRFCFNSFRHNDISHGIEHSYIAYMREGHAHIVAGKQSFSIKEGEFFFLPKHFQYHSYWYPEKSGVIRFDSYAFRNVPRRNSITYPPQAIPAFDEAIELNNKLSATKQVDFYSVGLFYQLLGLLVEKMVCVSEDQRIIIIEKAEEYMRNNVNAKVPDMAQHCGISQTGLYETFKRVKGYTPVAAKHRIIAERAKELLLTTDLSIEQISENLGIGTAAYFRKIFYKVTQKTPREVRKDANHRIL